MHARRSQRTVEFRKAQVPAPPPPPAAHPAQPRGSQLAASLRLIDENMERIKDALKADLGHGNDFWTDAVEIGAGGAGVDAVGARR